MGYTIVSGNKFSSVALHQNRAIVFENHTCITYNQNVKKPTNKIYNFEHEKSHFPRIIWSLVLIYLFIISQKNREIQNRKNTILKKRSKQSINIARLFIFM